MQSLPKSRRLYTEDEYLALERESEERHEYLDGVIYAVGESPYDGTSAVEIALCARYHSTICSNLTIEIGSQLKGQPCQLWTEDSRVLSGPIPKSHYSSKDLDLFADLIVVCGEPKFLDDHRDVLLNPKVIIEVLSPSTEAFDRGEKFRRYRTYVTSLTDYVVVAQHRPLVEHFAREEDGKWVMAATATELTDSVPLASIDCTLRLSDVYDRIVFPAPSDDEPAPATD